MRQDSEGSATISAAVANMKSSPTTAKPSLVCWSEPTPREDTPSFTPSSIRFYNVTHWGIHNFCLTIKLDPLLRETIL